MDSPRWLITTLKGVYVVENFLLGWSPRLRSSPPVAARRWDGIYTGTLENYKSLLKPVRCRHTDHHQRDSLFTSAIPRNSDDAKSPKAPSTYFSRTLNSTTNYSTQLSYVHESNSTYSTHTYSTTQLHPVSVPSQAIPHAIRSRDQCQDNGRRPHRSVGSTRRTSPPEGWRMEPRTEIHLEIEGSW